MRTCMYAVLGMAYVIMAYTVMAYIVVAYMVMAYVCEHTCTQARVQARAETRFRALFLLISSFVIIHMVCKLFMTLSSSQLRCAQASAQTCVSTRGSTRA